MKFKCLIVDDEAPARKLMTFYVSKISELDVVGTCQNGKEAKAFLEHNPVDILLLDIQMPNVTGVDLIKNLRAKPLTIFVTAHEEFAVQGYEMDIIDYLVKPVSFERFKKAIDKALEYIRFREGDVKKDETSSVPREYFFIKSDTKIVKLSFSDVIAIEAQQDYVKVITPTKTILTLMSMNQLEESLPSDFVRIHRSFIVNFSHIEEVQGNQIQIGKEIFPIGKNYKDAFFMKLQEHKL